MFDYKNMIAFGARSAMTEKQFFEMEIRNWKKSKARANRLPGKNITKGGMIF